MIRCLKSMVVLAVIACVGIVWAQGGRTTLEPRVPQRGQGGAKRYTAQVTGVSLGQFPAARVNLNVEGVGNLVAEPYYVTARDRIDFTSPITQQNLVCYYLMAGDRITFSVMPAPKGSIITDVQRVGTRGQVQPTAPRDTGGGAPVVQAKIETDKWSYAPGETVRIVLTVTNPTSEEVRFATPSSQQYDFSVYENEREIWRWSHGRMFAMMVGEIAIKPGDSLVFSESWGQKTNEGEAVRPGTYKLVGKLATVRSVEPPSASATVTIAGGV